MSFMNINIPAQPAPANAPAPGPAGSDPKPAPASGPPSVPSTSPGSPGAPAAPSAPAADTDDTDLDFGLDDTDDGTSGAPAEDSDAEPAPPPGSQYEPDDYTWQPPEGQHVSEAGQAIVSSFAEHAHDANMAPETFEASINWYNAEVAKLEAQRQETDKASRGTLVTSLRKEWGQSYDANRAVVDQGFKSLPQSLRTAIKSARTPDGRLLSSMPELVSLMHTIGRNSTPTNDAADDLKTEETARHYMKNDFREYINGGWADKLTRIIQKRGGT